MKELVVVSGKGGTGKTSVVASFAALAGLADCDVDAANLHLVLGPRVQRTTPFVGGRLARVDPDLCAACGQCAELCRFGAPSLDGPGNGAADATYMVDPLCCEGCGVCAEHCPGRAITLTPSVGGEWFTSLTRHGPMVHARLGVGGENSGKLVALVRKEAKARAEADGSPLVICDGPPGIGCPVIAAIGGADLLLIMVEPSLAALHDFERVVKLARHFGVPGVACVNKFDLNAELPDEVEDRAASLGVEVTGRIPYDESVTAAQRQGMSAVEYSDVGAARAIANIWKQVTDRLAPKPVPARVEVG